jgi:hypothetical protein
MPFDILSFFTRKKIDKLHKIYSKMWREKMLKERNQINNFILCQIL